MKILVVDDEKDVQTLFEQRFRKEIREKEIEFIFAFLMIATSASLSDLTFKRRS